MGEKNIFFQDSTWETNIFNVAKNAEFRIMNIATDKNSGAKHKSKYKVWIKTKTAIPA